MIDVPKVKGYKSAFTRLSNDSENNFEKYLQSKNLTVIDFLMQVGMNPKLIKVYNYDEIEKIAKEFFDCNGFPDISYPTSEETKNDPLYILNKDTGNEVVITNNSIGFISSDSVAREEDYENNYSLISYNIVNGNIQKKRIDVTVISKEESLPITLTNNGVGMRVAAKEVICDPNGQILDEGSYNFSINYISNNITFASINRSFAADSILTSIYTVIQLIADGKLKREDVDIELNISNLQKKQV